MALGDAYITGLELADIFRIGDPREDLQLELAAQAASEWVTSYCGKDFNLADEATARLFHAADAGAVWTDPIGSTEGLIVATEVGDVGAYTSIWDAADYQLTPTNAATLGVPFTRIEATGSKVYPHRMSRPGVQVTARWGWPTVPSAVKQATAILGAALYKRRDSAEGVLGGFGDFGPVRVGVRLDPHVEQLLGAYRDIALA